MRSKNATAPLDHIFYALSDPTRRAIVTSLVKGEANVSELVRNSQLSFPTVSKHLKVLERANLIRRKVDPEDARAFVFEPNPGTLRQATQWLERQRQYWDDRLDELEAFLSDQATSRRARRP